MSDSVDDQPLIAPDVRLDDGALAITGVRLHSSNHVVRYQVSSLFCAVKRSGYKSTQSPFANEAIETITAIEKKIRGWSAEERRAARQVRRRAIMTAFHAGLLAVWDELSQTSTLTQAIDDALEHWAGMTRFLDRGRLAPDTNCCRAANQTDYVGKKE